MAEGFLKTFDPALEVYSAGTDPGNEVHPKAIVAMREMNIDISGNRPKNVSEFLDQPFDYVITVCDAAKETCPYFSGEVKHRLHIGFEDPAEATGTDEEIMAEFRRIRNEILVEFFKFYQNELKEKKHL